MLVFKTLDFISLPIIISFHALSLIINKVDLKSSWSKKSNLLGKKIQSSRF